MIVDRSSDSDLSCARGQGIIMWGMSDGRQEAMQNMIWVM